MEAEDPAGEQADQVDDVRRYMETQQSLLRQATQSLRECADENERLVAENRRLEAREWAARSREALDPTRLHPLEIARVRSLRENRRLEAENGRLEAEIARLRDAAPPRVIPSVVWPEPAEPLTVERFRSGAGYLGQALRHYVQNITRWGGVLDNRYNCQIIQNLSPDQHHDIGLALYNGWLGDE